MTETTHEALVRQTGAAEELLDYFQGQRAAHDARIAVKEAEVDTFLGGAVNGISLPVMLAYDPTVYHSKSTLFAAGSGVGVDPAAAWQSEWRMINTFTVPSEAYVYPDVRRAFALFSRGRITNTSGSGNNPPYSSDYSRSRCDLVLANHTCTSVEINQWLLNNPDAPSAAVPGHWGTTSWSSEIPLIQIAGKNPSTTAFYRVRNEITPPAIAAGGATANSPLQDIITNGGNPYFGLHRIECRDI